MKKAAKSSKSYTEAEILAAKTPDDYIERTLNSKITSGRKAALAKEWMDKTGFTTEDIKYARHRHPYWKSMKMKGSKERNEQRIREHNYAKSSAKIDWTEDGIEKFIEENKKDKTGKYLAKDWELAKEFKVTIPSIQHLRRKYNMIEKIVDLQGKKKNKKLVVKMMLTSEAVLRRELKKIK